MVYTIEYGDMATEFPREDVWFRVESRLKLGGLLYAPKPRL